MVDTGDIGWLAGNDKSDLTGTFPFQYSTIRVSQKSGNETFATHVGNYYEYNKIYVDI